MGALSDRPNITRACKRAKISRAAAYEERKKSTKFAAQWDEAKRLGLDAALDEAWDRAFDESDPLLKWMISKNLPEYADKLEIEDKSSRIYDALEERAGLEKVDAGDRRNRR